MYWICHANTWGRNIIWRVSVRTYGRRVWKNIHFQQYNLYWLYHANTWGRNINFYCFCAPLRARGLEIYNFKNIILYRIYHANTWGKNIFLRVSVHPYGRRVGKYTISIILVCTGYIMPTIMCIVGNVHVNNINH